MNDRHPPKMRDLSCACACVFLLHFSSLNVLIFPFMPLLLKLLVSSFTSSSCCQSSCKHQSRQYSFEVVKQVKNNLQGQIDKFFFFFFNVDFYGTVIQPFTVEVKCFFNTITELLKWMLIQLGVLMSNPGNKKDRLLNEIISSKKQNKSALTLALHFY